MTNYVLGSAAGIVIGAHHGAERPPRTVPEDVVATEPVAAPVGEAWAALDAETREQYILGKIRRTVTLTLPAECDRYADLDLYVDDSVVVGEMLPWPRGERNRRLAATDYVDAAGWRTSQSAEALAACDAYRAALRDLPTTSPDPWNVQWPMASEA